MFQPKKMHRFLILLAIVFSFIFLMENSIFARTEKGFTVDPSVFSNLKWRSIGPAIMGGRLTDIEGVAGNLKLLYVASASGGLWKTEDGGITWQPIFDTQPVLSIGDIALEPGNPDVIWVGTGEDNPRNSVSFGKGVFRSRDGGKTWEFMGLEETERISRIIVHPKNPNVVYVAAIGHVFGPDPNRGVFMTEDGGKTWKKVLYIDEYHGASDLEMDPQNPNVLYAGMWYFQRKPWDFDSGSRKGGLFKSIDGGKTWRKLTKGLPEEMGRIGVKVAPSNPKIVYVIVEAKECALYRSDDGGETFRCVHKEPDIVSRGFYYTELRVDPKNENRVFAISSRLWLSEDGGKTFKRIAQSIHVDFHTMWIDPENPERIWLGNDGGLAVSYNGGKTWEFVNNLVLGQFYQIHADNRLPFYYVCGGLQDNGTWCGPSRTRGRGGILNDYWYSIGGGDGFYVLSHPEKPWIYLVEYQAGGISRVNLKTGEEIENSPYPKRNNGGPAEALKYRFNWNSPIVRSPHDPNTVYFAGNVVFRSRDFGLTWERISPDLTTNDPSKLKSAGGPIFPENTTAEYHCTIISFAESPVKAGVLWAGTDDGNLQLSVDDGKNWKNVVKNIKGLPPFSPVSHVEPSRRGAGVAYVAFDRHMFDDFAPYIYVTEDFGKTWRKIVKGLPRKGYVHVVREDPRNPNVLYAGTEVGLYISWDRGQHWAPLKMANLPAVSVHDILIHPRENDLILGTHGRSIWIFDDATPIQQINREILQKELHVFPPRDALLFSSMDLKGRVGDKAFVGPNPPYGALIYYYLKKKPEGVKEGKVLVYDKEGKLIRKLKFKPEEGVNLLVWDLAYDGPEPRKKEERESFFRSRGPKVLPGTYKVTVKIGKLEESIAVKVKLDPLLQVKEEELKEQLQVSLKLRDMISNLNLILRNLDSVEEQLKNLNRTLEEVYEKPPKEVFNRVEQLLEKVKKLKGNIIRESRLSWAGGSRLLDHLRSLYWGIQRPFRAPTKAQMELLREVEQEYNLRMKEAEELLKKDIKEFNFFLKERNLPVILYRSGEKR